MKPNHSEENEIWKVVPNFTDYAVSNKGRVRSYKINKSRGRLLKPFKNPGGYNVIVMSRPRFKATHIGVARLVAIAFLPNPENHRVVNHINCIKSDNRVENLEWCTHKENSIHYANSSLREERVKAKIKAFNISFKKKYSKSYDDMISESVNSVISKMRSSI